jgi:hypothetical protein
MGFKGIVTKFRKNKISKTQNLENSKSFNIQNLFNIHFIPPWLIRRMQFS